MINTPRRDPIKTTIGKCERYSLHVTGSSVLEYFEKPILECIKSINKNTTKARTPNKRLLLLIGLILVLCLNSLFSSSSFELLTYSSYFPRTSI